MSRRTVPVVLAIAGLLCLLWSGPAAQALDAPTSAWWSRVATTTPTDEAPVGLPVPAPTTPGTLPAGATVPEGHLLVEGTPEGATAVAAAKWRLAEGESSPSLTLAVGDGSTINPESIVLACKAAAPWTPPEANPGPWDAKPLVDPGRCVNGVIAEDLSTVSFGLQPLVSGDELDVVLVPGKVAAGPAPADGSAFRLVVEAPSADSLDVVAGSDFDQGTGDVFVPPAESAPPASVGGSPAPIDSSSPSLPSPSSSSGVSPAPVVSGIEEPVAAPALEPQELAPSVPDVSDAVEVVSAEDAERTIGFILLLLAAIAAGWAHLTQKDAPDIGLGRFRTPAPTAATATATSVGVNDAGGPPTVGGLSRFARERTTPPSRLA